MSRIKDIIHMQKIYKLPERILLYIPLFFATSIIYNLVNSKGDLIWYLSMIFIVYNSMVGLQIREIMSRSYNVITTFPYKIIDVIKSIFVLTEMFVLVTFIFDIVVNFSCGNNDIAFSHLAICFICLMFNYIMITIMVEKEMKLSGTQMKRIVIYACCSFGCVIFASCINAVCEKFEGSVKLIYFHCIVAIVFAFCDIFFRKAFINKAIKKIRG